MKVKLISSVFGLFAGAVYAISMTMVSSAYAAPLQKQCQVVGLKTSKQYILKNEYTCYKKEGAIRAAGFFKTSARNLRAARKPEPKMATNCKFMAIDDLGIYYKRNKLRCFASQKKALKAKYTRLIIPTPTVVPNPNGTLGTNQPTPSPTATEPPTTVDPTPTVVANQTPPVVGKGVVNYSFVLSAHEPGSGYGGDCTGVLNDAHTILDLTCNHNVTTASEVHLHIVPENPKFCVLLTPSSPFELHCELTEQQAVGIENGNGLIAIHLAAGGVNQAAVGYIRNE